MTRGERLAEVASVIVIAALALWVEHRTGQGMLPLIMDSLPPLPGIETKP
jgi:hypothetical protein